MVWWVVDNLAGVLLGLGIVALCLAAAWWSRRNNKLLIGIAVPVALMALAWILSLFIVTDRMQLRRIVEAMRDEFNAGKIDEAISHFDDDVTVLRAGGDITIKKSELAAMAQNNIKNFSIKGVFINTLQVDEVARPKATVSFIVGLEDKDEQRARCIMGFVLGTDGKWRVRTFTVETLIGGKKLL